jgi:hypothetical protein
MLGGKDEFVIHFSEMHDYRFLLASEINAPTTIRNNIIDALKRLYADKQGGNLPIYEVEDKHLK